MMNSGYHNRNKKDRRDSPSSSSRPRSSSKTSAAVNNEANQRNRTPPKSINGKMPSVANSPSSEAIITDGMANLVLKKITHPVGSKITAKLNTGAVMKGEIVAYDSEYKVVIMRTPGSRPGHHNVSILNLVNCVEIKVDEECKESPGVMPEMNMNKLDERRKIQTERKIKLITAFKAGISPEGQKLYQCINKTLDEIMWQNDKILVMNKVIIEPPYRPEHVRIKQGIKEDDSTLKNLNHIRKIVERFSETENSKSTVGGSSSTTPSAPVSGSTAYTDSASVASPVTAASVASRTSAGPSGSGPLTSNTSGSASGLTTTIPNLPQAPAVPQSSASSHSKQPPGGGGSNPGGGSRSNRNNAGRKQHGSFVEINNNMIEKKT